MCGEGFVCRRQGLFLLGSEAGKSKREFLSVGAGGCGSVMRWKIRKGQEGMLSLMQHWEMPCRCKLSVHPGCSGERRGEGGCLGAQEGMWLILV